MIKAIIFDLDGTLLPMDQDKFVKSYIGRMAGKLAPFGYDPELLTAGLWKGTGAMVKNNGEKTNEEVFWSVFNAILGKDCQADEELFMEYYRNEFQLVAQDCGFDPAASQVIALLKEKGYQLQSAQAVDLFPRCSHIETVALLNRQINVHKMKLNSAPFEMIKSGIKTIELRLFDEKRQQVKIGDTIVFTNTATGETLHTTVAKLHRFDSFAELYKSLPLLKCGYTTEDIDEATPADMEQYYSMEEQEKYGIVGIELFPTKQITDGSII